MRVLVFAVIALAVAASATPAAQDLISRLHKAQSSKDFEGLANLYADNAVLSVNGNKTSGRAAIKSYYTTLLTPLLVQSFQTNSPIYSTAANVFHFAQQGFYSKEDATLGECLAVVHSLERIATDGSGKIAFQRSEWEETKKQFDDDLKCEHHEDHHKHEAIQDRIVERTFERHRQVEGLEFNRFLKGFQANASLITAVNADGTPAESQEGSDAIRAFYHPLFNKSSSIAFSPCSPVYIRDKSTFSVSSLFVVTHTGCSYNAQIIFYNSFTDKANVTTSEQLFVAPASYKGLLDVLAQDCGRKKAEGVGRKVNDLGDGEDDAHETIEEDDEEEEEELEDYHDDL